MTEDDLREMIEAGRRVREQYASTPELARQLLREEGVIDESGNLTPQYAPQQKASALLD